MTAPPLFSGLRMRMAMSHGAVLAFILLVLGGAGQALLARSVDRSATHEVLTAAQQAADVVSESGPNANPTTGSSEPRTVHSCSPVAASGSC